MRIKMVIVISDGHSDIWQMVRPQIHQCSRSSGSADMLRWKGRRQHLKIERRQGYQVCVFALLDTNPVISCAGQPLFQPWAPRSLKPSPSSFSAQHCVQILVSVYAVFCIGPANVRTPSVHLSAAYAAQMCKGSESGNDCIKGLECKANVIHRGQRAQTRERWKVFRGLCSFEARLRYSSTRPTQAMMDFVLRSPSMSGRERGY